MEETFFFVWGVGGGSERNGKLENEILGVKVGFVKKRGLKRKSQGC